MRYARNRMTISEAENETLKSSAVCVVGCGGLGGYIIEMLGRIGVGRITAIDGDVFDITNLNRQLLSNMQNLGCSKAEAALKRMADVNPEIQVTAVQTFLNTSNVVELLKGHHVVVDALDQIGTRLMLQEAAETLGIPMVHGAIAGWYGQVCTVYPGERTLNKIYKNGGDRGQEKKLGNPSFTPAVIASIEVSEVVKVLLDKGELLRNGMLFVNLLNQEYERIDFS